MLWMVRSVVVVGGSEALLGASCDDVSARAPRPKSAEPGVAAASSESASRINTALPRKHTFAKRYEVKKSLHVSYKNQGLWVHCALRRHNFIVRLASYSDARTRTRRGLVTAQCHRHEHGSRLIEKPRLKAICSFLAGGRQKDAKVVRWRLN